jgi:hypothetical protein
MSTGGDTVDIEIDIEGLKQAKETIDGLARYFDSYGDFSLDQLASQHSTIATDWGSWNDGGTAFVSQRISTVSGAVNQEIAKLKADLAAISGLLQQTITDHDAAEQENRGVVAGTGSGGADGGGSAGDNGGWGSH